MFTIYNLNSIEHPCHKRTTKNHYFYKQKKQVNDKLIK